jgi:hypothetical protein
MRPSGKSERVDLASRQSRCPASVANSWQKQANPIEKPQVYDGAGGQPTQSLSRPAISGKLRPWMIHTPLPSTTSRPRMRS